MKKILIFTHEWPPYLGGVGTVAYQLAKWYVNNNYSVTVVTRKQNEIYQINNLNLYQVDTKPYFWFASYKTFFNNELSLDEFDHIILNECAPTISAAGFFSDEHYKKTSIIIHGLEIENIYSDRISNIMRRLFFFRYKHIKSCLKAKNIIFVGEFIKNKFLMNSGLDISHKSKIIYAGVDSDIFILSGNHNEKRNRKELVVVTASRVTKMKGYPEMFSLMRKAILINKNIKWIICGDGDYLPFLKKMATESDVTNNIEFRGSCSREELNNIYSIADIYLLLSRYDEALPLSYIEAQLSGLYCIGYNKGGVIETIKPGVSGELLDDHSDILNLIISISNNVFLIPEKSSIREAALNFDMNLTLTKLKML